MRAAAVPIPVTGSLRTSLEWRRVGPRAATRHVMSLREMETPGQSPPGERWSQPEASTGITAQAGISLGGTRLDPASLRLKESPSGLISGSLDQRAEGVAAATGRRDCAFVSSNQGGPGPPLGLMKGAREATLVLRSRGRFLPPSMLASPGIDGRSARPRLSATA